MVLPGWQETFHTAPRDVVPPPAETAFSRAMGFVSGVLFASAGEDAGVGAGGGRNRGGKGKVKGLEREWVHFGKELPRAWDVVEGRVGAQEESGKGKGKGGGIGVGVGVGIDPDVLRGCKRVVVIGIHGWFPGTFLSSSPSLPD